MNLTLNFFREAVRVVVQDLTQTLTKDINKRMCETLGFYLLDKWWAEQEQKYKEKVVKIFLQIIFHTIRKVKFLSKNSILTKLQHFHEFFIQIFLTIFLVKSKLSTAKKSKNHNIFTSFSPKNLQFSREIKVEFLDKK